MILYHITKIENIDSILEKGILPNYKRGITHWSIKQNYVFLTNNVDKIIKEQIGLCWGKEIVIIEVDIFKYEPYLYKSTNKISDFEFITDRVLPEEIKNILFRHVFCQFFHL